MKYLFTKQDIDVLQQLDLSFDPNEDLSEKDEMFLLDTLLSRFGTEADERFEIVYQHMAEQAEKYNNLNEKSTVTILQCFFNTPKRSFNMCNHKFIGLADGVWCTKYHCQMMQKEYAEYLTR